MTVYKYFTFSNVLFFVGLFGVDAYPDLCPALASVVQQNVFIPSAPLSKLEHFLDFLWNVHEIVSPERSLEENNALMAALEEAEHTAFELYSRLQEDAAGKTPHFHSFFQELPMGFSAPLAWPEPCTLSEWQENFEFFKKDLISFYNYDSQLARLENRFRVVNLLGTFNKLLSEKILTREFFGFSRLDSVFDFCVTRPKKFIKKHPYFSTGIIIGGMVVSFLTYWHLTRFSRWTKAHDAEIIRSQQTASDCGVWALYAQWCFEQATHNGVTDMERYRSLRTDRHQYDTFKAGIGHILEHSRPPGYQGSLTDNLPNSVVRAFIEYYNASGVFSAIPRDGVHRDQSPAFVEALNFFDTGHLEEVRFRGTDGRLYPTQQEVPAGVGIVRQELHGLRHDQANPWYWYVRHFNQAQGNHIDFIANLADIPQGNYNPRQHHANSLSVNHFIHVRATNDPTAQGGVRLTYSDSATPNLEGYEHLGNGIRALLQPLQPLNP